MKLKHLVLVHPPGKAATVKFFNTDGPKAVTYYRSERNKAKPGTLVEYHRLGRPYRRKITTRETAETLEPATEKAPAVETPEAEEHILEDAPA